MIDLAIWLVSTLVIIWAGMWLLLIAGFVVVGPVVGLITAFETTPPTEPEPDVTKWTVGAKEPLFHKSYGVLP